MARAGSGTHYLKTTIGNISILRTNWSMHARVRASAIPSGNLRPILNFRNPNASHNPDCGLYWDHSSSTFQKCAYNRAGGGGGAYGAAKMTSSLSADTWYSFGASYDNTNVRIYFEGALETTTAIGASTTFESSEWVLMAVLHAGAIDSGTQFSTGQIAECAIWNDVLTADHFVAMAKGFRPHRVRPQNLIAYTPLVANDTELMMGPLTSSGTPTNTDHPRVF